MNGWLKYAPPWIAAILAISTAVGTYYTLQAKVEALEQAVNINRLEDVAAWRARVDAKIESLERQVRCQWKRLANESC